MSISALERLFGNHQELSIAYTFKKACFWGLFKHHVNSAGNDQLSTGRRFAHGFLATLEFLPVISQIVSLLEYAAARVLNHLYKKNASSPPKQLDTQNNNRSHIQIPQEAKEQSLTTPHLNKIKALHEDEKAETVLKYANPIGITGGGNNCCIKVLLQMIANIPSIKKIFKEIDEIKSFIKVYEEVQLEHQENPTGKYQIDGEHCENIRALLAKCDSSVSWMNNEQEDPLQILMILFDHVKYAGIPVHRINSRMTPHCRTIQIREDHFGESKTSSLAALFRASFNLKGRQFQSPPDELFIDHACVKNNAFSIKGEMATLSLRSEFFVDGLNATYECDFFTLHAGNSSKSGHYTAAVKIDNVWHLLNENIVSVMAPDDVEEQIRHATFLHYSKI